MVCLKPVSLKITTYYFGHTIYETFMKKILKVFGHNLLDSAKDLAPIVLVIGFFQLIVLQQSKEKGECSPYPKQRNPLNNKQRRRWKKVLNLKEEIPSPVFPLVC
jgi:hypothetical protein